MERVSLQNLQLEMKFYHSFPRVSRKRQLSRTEQDCLGIGILRSVLHYGLLLTPEPLEIPPNPDSDLRDPPATVVIQRRACFTLLSRKELIEDGKHLESFGRFSIGLDTNLARGLGIVPTFYYYKSNVTENSDPFDSGISQQVLFRLSELRRLAIALARVEAHANPKSSRYRPRDYLNENGLTFDDEPDVASVDSVSRTTARQLTKLLGTDRVPAWNLAEWIELILSMFQTADSSERGRHLAYYEQREWRCIQLYGEKIDCYSLTQREMESLRDPFKLRILIEARSVLKRMLNRFRVGVEPEDCFLLIGCSHNPFRDFVSEIIVPSAYRNETLHTLKEMGMIEYFSELESHDFTVFERKKPAKGLPWNPDVSHEDDLHEP